MAGFLSFIATLNSQIGVYFTLNLQVDETKKKQLGASVKTLNLALSIR